MLILSRITVVETYIEDLKYLDDLPKTENKINLVLRYINNLNNLKGKSECPICRGDIDKKLIENELFVLNKTLERLRLQDEKEKEEKRPFIEEERKRKEIESKTNDENAIKYLELNRSLFKKLVKQYRYGDQENLLPKIPDSEKETWNRAMKKFLASSKSYKNIDEFDLMY